MRPVDSRPELRGLRLGDMAVYGYLYLTKYTAMGQRFCESSGKPLAEEIQGAAADGSKSAADCYKDVSSDGVMETSRIVLRPWRDSDAAVLYKWASDPDVGPRAGWAPHQSVEESLEVIRTVFNDVTNTWAIELKETGEAIGAMGFGPSCNCNLPARDGEPLIGYWIAKPYWNRGICTDALRLMIEHIRRVTDVKSLISGHFVDNPASGRVMEKCGFVPTGETVIDETQYQGADRPIRVLRLEL